MIKDPIIIVDAENHTRHESLPDNFDVVVIKLTVERRSFFYVVYFLLPCIVLALLMYISFSIPPDSGERLGFCSSLLLALSVYLLLLTEMIPNSSHISILGFLFVVVFLDTAMALLATVIVLKAFHSTNEIPCILRCLCGFGCSSKSKGPMKTKVTPLKLFRNSDESKVTSVEEAKTQEEVEPGLSTTSPSESEENQRRWNRVARRLDKIFFWLFVVVMLASIIFLFENIDNLQKLNFH